MTTRAENTAYTAALAVAVWGVYLAACGSTVGVALVFGAAVAMCAVAGWAK